MDVMFQLIVCRIELVDFREEPTLRSPNLLLLANRLLRIEGHVVEGNTNDVSNLISNASLVPRTEFTDASSLTNPRTSGRTIYPYTSWCSFLQLFQ